MPSLLEDLVKETTATDRPARQEAAKAYADTISKDNESDSWYLAHDSYVAGATGRCELADRVEEDTRTLGERWRAKTAQGDHPAVLRSARKAADLAVSRVSEAEAFARYRRTQT